MKKFFALLLALVLMLNCTIAMADVQLLNKHNNLDILNESEIFTITNIKNIATLRATLVICTLLDFMNNGILNELPDSANQNSICVSLDEDDVISVYIPLEGEILSLMLKSGTNFYGYFYSDIDINSKSGMESLMDYFIDENIVDYYWLVSADDLLEVATAISESN